LLGFQGHGAVIPRVLLQAHDELLVGREGGGE
jgi:hypothetical protein